MPEHTGVNSLHTTTASRIVQVAGSVHGDINIGDGAARTREPSDGWGRLVATARVWDHVPANRDVRRTRAQAVDAAIRLSRLRDEAASALEDDPWRDPDFVTRFVDHVDWLVGEPDPAAPLDLFPAEAALLVLVPLIYHVHYLQTAARLVVVSPWQLGVTVDRNPERTAFDEFADRYGSLLHRARLQPSSERALGWWIFHRWLVHRDFADEQQVEPLCADLGDELVEVFTGARVSALLHGLRRGPSVCSPEYLSGLRADDQVRRAGNQRIREQRLALLLALAYGVSIEMHTMPDVVAEHLGIPDPVDLRQLGETLDRVSWTGSHQVPVLSAQCHHAAVIEGLRAHVARTDELLHAVHRTARERITHPMPSLPARLSSDDVLPVDAAVTGWASFRIDGPRIRELLMGETLYKDRDLAVRELYQNGLDACRHREARTRYLNRTRVEKLSFEGRIEIVQDVDADGRPYVECRENGIGMGDAELRGVFSKAGARFAEQPDFRQEQAAWQRLDPPIGFYPNSRFGIGVLSYFMLAEEIRVTTCRMGLDGALGPVLTATMFGPEHLFRITEVSPRGDQPGTVVRLYLKDRSASEAAGWSAPAVLERLLGVAEFATVARHGDQWSEWAPGQVKVRRSPDSEDFSYNAHGTLVEWGGAPDGVSVAWCAQGGALLVDGLVVQPAVRSGVVDGPRKTVTGFVVNLSGEYAPELLSVDRSTVLSDVSEVVEELLEQAAEAVLAEDRKLLCVEWLSQISEYNLRLADVVTAMVLRHGLTISCGKQPVPVGQTGFLRTDMRIMGIAPDWRKISLSYGPSREKHLGSTPDVILLWRALAHRSGRVFADLVELCPELADIGPVRSALPSREKIVTAVQKSSWDKYGRDFDINELVASSVQAGLSLRGLLAELSSFGIDCVQLPDGQDVPVSAPALHMLCGEGGNLLRRAEEVTVSGLVRAARHAERDMEEVLKFWIRCGIQAPWQVLAAVAAFKEGGWLGKRASTGDLDRNCEPGGRVRLGYLVRLGLDLGRTIPEVSSMLLSAGCEVDPTWLPEHPTEELAKMLSYLSDGNFPWLDHARSVPPACLLRIASALDLNPHQVAKRYVELGFEVSKIPSDASSGDVEALWSELYREPLNSFANISYYDIFSFSGDRLRWAVDRLIAYGFQVPLRLPVEFDHLDDVLLSNDGVVDWGDETTGARLPFAKVVLAASRLNIEPPEIADRLTLRGVSVSGRDLPSGLSFSAALQLLDFYRADDEYFDFDREPILSQLMEMSYDMRVPISRLVYWLNGLGLRTPDVVALVRAAADAVPKAG